MTQKEDFSTTAPFLIHPIQHRSLGRGEDAGRRYLQPLLGQLKGKPAPAVGVSLAHLLRVGPAQRQKSPLQSLIVGVDAGGALGLIEVDDRFLLQ